MERKKLFSVWLIVVAAGAVATGAVVSASAMDVGAVPTKGRAEVATLIRADANGAIRCTFDDIEMSTLLALPAMPGTAGVQMGAVVGGAAEPPFVVDQHTDGKPETVMVPGVMVQRGRFVDSQGNVTEWEGEPPAGVPVPELGQVRASTGPFDIVVGAPGSPGGSNVVIADGRTVRDGTPEECQQLRTSTPPLPAPPVAAAKTAG